MTEDHASLTPRETFAFENGEALDDAFRQACDRGRLHHAWLLTGPQGLGKASFAFRCARFLMGKQRDPSAGALGMAREDSDVRLITAHSHPDLMVLEREPGKKTISVDATREIGEFFSKAPSRSPWRVCIIDAIDDMNLNSANALLKVLEEPPHKGIIFLVSHNPGRLLPTIRSRCRRLAFAPWNDIEVNAFLNQRRPDVDEDDRARLVRLARGAPGRTLSLLDQGVLELDTFAEALLSTTPPPRHDIMQMAASFKANSAKVDGAARFANVMACLSDRVRDLALRADSPLLAQNLSQIWSKLDNASSEVESVNLDRNEYFWQLYNELRE